MNIHILTDPQLALLRQLLDGAGRAVVCAHKAPDGDAIGSILAWAAYLRQRGVEATCVVPDQAPDFLQWLPGFQDILRYDKHPDEVKAAFDKADLVCCLDFNETSRVEELQPVLDACEAPRLLIDHHVGPKVASSLTVSMPAACSTCELVFSLIHQMGGYEQMTREIATCIYCGMMTDTGGFTFASSRPEIFHIIALLLAKGINKDIIYNKVFHNYSLDALRLRAHVMLNKLRVVDNLRASYYVVTRREMQRFHFVKGDLEGLVNEPLTIKNHKLSISLREDTMRPNRINVSLRSSCGFHCREMAVRFFNGGGHEDAAGGHLNCSIDEAERQTIRAIRAFQSQL